jgi:hypothetical protein
MAGHLGGRQQLRHPGTAPDRGRRPDAPQQRILTVRRGLADPLDVGPAEVRNSGAVSGGSIGSAPTALSSPVTVTRAR